MSIAISWGEIFTLTGIKKFSNLTTKSILYLKRADFVKQFLKISDINFCQFNPD